MAAGDRLNAYGYEPFEHKHDVDGVKERVTACTFGDRGWGPWAGVDDDGYLWVVDWSGHKVGIAPQHVGSFLAALESIGVIKPA